MEISNTTPVPAAKAAEPSRADALGEKVVALSLAELYPFKNHPFQVKQDEELTKLAESIHDNGVLTPAIVRPRKEGGYELISGHRRKAASELAGMSKLPVIIRDVDDDTAILMMVDSNRQRENLLPSEKAFSYKMRLDAMKRQGKRPDRTSCQVGTKSRSDKEMAKDEDDSARTIQRFIRLTALIPAILKMVDDKKIAFNPAVELSYLPKDTQKLVVDWMEAQQATPSLAQAKTLKERSIDNKLSAEDIAAVLTIPKANQKEKLLLSGERFSKFFPKATTPKQLEDEIFRVLEERQKKLTRKREDEPCR